MHLCESAHPRSSLHIPPARIQTIRAARQTSPFRECSSSEQLSTHPLRKCSLSSSFLHIPRRKSRTSEPLSAHSALHAHTWSMAAKAAAPGLKGKLLWAPALAGLAPRLRPQDEKGATKGTVEGSVPSVTTP